MKNTLRGSCFLVAVVFLFAWAPRADALSGFYTENCQGCHGTTNTCAGCHAHGTHSDSFKDDINITGTTDKTSYSPGETVSVTIDGGYRSGWVRAILYDQNMTELARSTGTIAPGYSAPSGAPSFPVTLNAPAPANAGTYTWNVAWYGNQYDLTDAGGGTTYFGPRWTPDPGNPSHGQEIVSTNSFTVVSLTPPSKIAVFVNGAWYLDLNGSGAWNGAPPDALYSFGGGVTGAIPVAGDWDGDGFTEVGIYANGIWFLDLNGNGAWDGTPTDAMYSFGGGLPGALPIAADWNGDGKTEIGVYDNGIWYIDFNGNGAWDGTLVDVSYAFGVGLTGAVPVAGDWDASGAAEIGVYANGVWYLDRNGNGIWDGTPTDSMYVFGAGLTGAAPVTGDWNSTGTGKIGIYHDGVWYLDINGDGAWNDTPTDKLYIFGAGLTGAMPATGKW